MKEFELKLKVLNGEEKWTFNYSDGLKLHNKTCRGCRTEKEALSFMTRFRKEQDNQYLIKNIAGDMFLPESDHLRRLNDFGKHPCNETIQQKRQFIELIINVFGNEAINNLPAIKIMNYLLKEHKNHSGSWKNFYLETFGNIYDETAWKCKTAVPKPDFQRFARNSKKPDIFSADELLVLMNRENWISYKEWLLFSITASCGLRLGEARALQTRQFKLYEGILVVDGFLKRDGWRTNYNKKGNSTDRKIRCVPVPSKILCEVADYIAVNRMESNDYLFLDDNNRTYTNCHLEWSFKKALEKSGIKTIGKRFVPHSLRFTYVTKMRTALPVEDVRKIVGHTTIEMTEYYTQTMVNEMCSALQPTREIVSNLFN